MIWKVIWYFLYITFCESKKNIINGNWCAGLWHDMFGPPHSGCNAWFKSTDMNYHFQITTDHEIHSRVEEVELNNAWWIEFVECFQICHKHILYATLRKNSYDLIKLFPNWNDLYVTVNSYNICTKIFGFFTNNFCGSCLNIV